MISMDPRLRTREAEAPRKVHRARRIDNVPRGTSEKSCRSRSSKSLKWPTLVNHGSRGPSIARWKDRSSRTSR